MMQERDPTDGILRAVLLPGHNPGMQGMLSGRALGHALGVCLEYIIARHQEPDRGGVHCNGSADGVRHHPK
jgi:hypothetical protein